MQMIAIGEVLGGLVDLEGVRAAYVTARDGLVIASAGEGRDSADLRAALTAAVFATVDRAFSQLSVGTARLVTIETDSHRLHVAALGDLLLGVVSDRRTNPAVVRWEMRRVARRFALAVSEPSPADGISTQAI